MSSMKVIKRNGKEEDISFDKILHRIKKLIIDKKLGILENVHADVISQEVISKLYDKVTTEELDNLTARIAIGYSIDQPNYEQLALRVAVSNLHKKTTECFSSVIEKMYNNKNKNNEHTPLISEELFNIVKKNKKKLNFAITYDRDYTLSYLGFKTLERSYLIKMNGEIIERPQHLWMRVALGLHKEDIESAIQTYELTSQGYFTHATPTLFNAGTNRPSMSSCFLLDIDDSMEGIYKCLSDCAVISKNAGGIGIAISDIRSEGSYIKGTNGTSDGIMKMLKVFNETARYANQGSKRNGSFAVYLEPHHSDIFNFLEMRRNVGEENLKCRDLFSALWISDTFMEAVQNDTDWYLMSSNECPNLTEVYGDEYKSLYYSYVNQGKYVKKIKARDLWDKILVAQIETGMPYMSYKDHANKKSNQKNIGIIKSSNLCVHGDTLILTDRGYLPIKDLQDIKTNVWNGEQFSEVMVKRTNNNSELIKMYFNNGKDLICTPYHKFYVKVKNENQEEKIIQKEAKDLTPEDNLFTCSYPVIDYNKNLKVNFTQGDQDIFYSTSYLPPINYDINTKIKWLQEFTEKYGKINKNWLIFKFYRSYTSFIVGNIKKRLQDVQFMLNTIGIDSILKEKYAYYIFPSYTLEISPKNLQKLSTLKFIHYKINLRFSELFEDIPLNLVKTEKVKNDSTYCFNEPINHAGVFNGILTGNCNEIYIASNTKEYGTCNIATIGLAKYVNYNELKQPIYDFQKLYEITRIIVRNMNKVIDYNFYPVKETKVSNFNHRPIAIGIQGLANLFFIMKIPFESKEAKELNKKIFETIQYASIFESKEQAKIHGPYSSFKGSPASEGIFQHNLWGISNNDLSGMWDWDSLASEVKEHGLRNSLLTALPPTASTSQILGNYESFEPVTNNLFLRSTLSGDYPVINKYLVNDLIKLKLWNEDIKNSIIENKGSIQHIKGIPQNIKDIYKTVWEIPQKVLMELSAERAPFIDHSQSLNLFFESPTPNKLSSAHFYGWKLGLKTTMYYCRSRPRTTAQQFTVKQEVLENAQLSCSLENPESCAMCSG